MLQLSPNPGARGDLAVSASRNPAIEGLRGACAAMVVGYHVYGMAVKSGFCQPVPLFFLEHLGQCAVATFFVISGYLITGSLASHPNTGRFLANRVRRIYPLFLALHAIIFAIGPFIDYEWMGPLKASPSAYVTHFLSNLAFLPGTFDLPIAQKNAWSLSYEWVFYLVAALTAAGLSRAARRRTLGAASCLVGASLVATAMLVAHPAAGYFLIGVAARLLPRSLARRIPNRGIFSANGLLAWSALLALQGRSLPLALAAAFFAFVSLSTQEGILAWILCRRPFQFLGAVSYSLYLVHPFAMYPLKALLARAPNWLGSDPLRFLFFGLIGGALSTVAAWFAHRWLEAPFLRRGASPGN